MPEQWTFEALYELSRGYQASSVVNAAAELDVFTVLADGPLSAAQVSRRIHVDARGAVVLLDALAALALVEKHQDRYHLDDSVKHHLGQPGSGSLLSMFRHQANCQRRWADLARAVQQGAPLDRKPSIRGEDADEQAFIEAMDNINAPIAAKLIERIKPPPFQHLLDVGGASGTWTIAFLQSNADSRATIFDLPHVIPLARQRLADAGLLDRVTLVAGDFYTDALPAGADLAWISAIVHQNSRPQNRALFTAVLRALRPGGYILIRDVVMHASRVDPPRGALFAVHMLLATSGGGTFTFQELREDLESAGFAGVALVNKDEGMNAVVQASKPALP